MLVDERTVDVMTVDERTVDDMTLIFFNFQFQALTFTSKKKEETNFKMSAGVNAIKIRISVFPYFVKILYVFRVLSKYKIPLLNVQWYLS